MPALLAPSRSPVVDDVTRRQVHMFGTAWISAKPERVDTVGCNGADFAAALGVVPVRARLHRSVSRGGAHHAHRGAVRRFRARRSLWRQQTRLGQVSCNDPGDRLVVQQNPVPAGTGTGRETTI